MKPGESAKSRSQYRRPESVLVAVHTRRGEVLLLHRCVPPAGIWQSVTGAIGWDETPAEAAARELAEETGLVGFEPVDAGARREFTIVPEARHRYAPGVTRNLEHAFRLELPGRQAISIDPAEHDDWGWFPAAEAARRVWSWTNRAALAELAGRR